MKKRSVLGVLTGLFMLFGILFVNTGFVEAAEVQIPQEVTGVGQVTNEQALEENVEQEIPEESNTEESNTEESNTEESNTEESNAEESNTEDISVLEESIVDEGVTLEAVANATAADVLIPNATNKKGIQGTDFKHGSTPDNNPASLNINHVLFNIDLAQVISTNRSGQPYVYKGNTYYFNYDKYVKVYEWRARELKAEGKALTYVVLMSWSDNSTLQNLIYPGAREKYHYYYGLNVNDPNAKIQIEAALHYLAEVFGKKDTFVQNWVMGNEINMPYEYNYTGTSDLDTNVDIGVKSFDMLYSALQSKNPHAKAYISLTNHWNSDNNGIGMSTKNFLDAFAAREKGKNWNIAFHAYPPQMKEQVWTKESAKWLRHDVGSKYVCGANIEVLTDYVKKQYGSSHRIILSEQGFDATYGNYQQAAMIAYTYFAAARNDMIDATMFLSWQDSSQSSHDGYKMGFLDENGNKREAYDVFKYMNSNQSAQYTNFYLHVLGITKWTDSILYKATPTSATINSKSLYLAEQTNDKVMIGMTTSTTAPTDLEFRWLIYDINRNEWSIVSDWTLNYEWLVWYPEKSGAFLIQGEARVAGNQKSYVTEATGVNIHKEIKGKCQIPYEKGGYLIGVESYRNPNQSYQYELLILDCTLLAQNKPAWVYSTGKCGVASGNAFWAVWQPKYGYYWTLFRVYDKNGNLIDEECYPFVNAY